MANRLAAENSPYLLQHADNPVHWFAWGPAAWEAARQQDKPIFVSIGYSACHWCHVMAHESFENAQIAQLLNDHFISIKVDREERPDVDQYYMDAVQLMGVRGGWPLSVFLSPSLEPFYGGTYWPPESRYGIPGFTEILRAVAEAWRQRRPEIQEQGRQLSAHLREAVSMELSPADTEIDVRPLVLAESQFLRSLDSEWGGFGGAPKFPPSTGLRVLLRRWNRAGNPRSLEAVLLTLDRMAAGGLYDHLGGGFHRYSVDGQWRIPHFEKMLYDNAQLAVCYLEAWQATKRPRYEQVVRETLDYIASDMTDPMGGFYSAEDADSEGEEGAFYVWTPSEICEALGQERGERFCRDFGVTATGNFEGKNVLARQGEPSQDADRAQLLAVRNQRTRPARDDKVLVHWNGLTIEAFARAGAALGERRYLEGAGRAADFILGQMMDADGVLLHAWRNGLATGRAFLDDYAAMTNALVTLYEATFDERRIVEAVKLAEQMQRLFADPERGGFFFAQAGGELPVRAKDLFDSAVPSGTGMATIALLRLGKLLHRVEDLETARRILAGSAAVMHQAPTAAGQVLLALDMAIGPTPELVLFGSGDATADSALLLDLNRHFIPSRVTAFSEPDRATDSHVPPLRPVFEGKTASAPGPTLFVCENFTCRAPVVGTEAVRATIHALAKTK